jgi:sulfatase maturation enzyme AslB (radical SAM superfamily)
MTPALQTRLLILQPTPFCNIDCNYCYLQTASSRRECLLHAAAGLRAAHRGRTARPKLDVVWHAGEPMVLPPDWYKVAMSLMAGLLSAQCVLTHSIQTNGKVAQAAGTLATKEWMTAYTAGDYLVSNNENGFHSYAIGADQFHARYVLDE